MSLTLGVLCSNAFLLSPDFLSGSFSFSHPSFILLVFFSPPPPRRLVFIPVGQFGWPPPNLSVSFFSFGGGGEVPDSIHTVVIPNEKKPKKAFL